MLVDAVADIVVVVGGGVVDIVGVVVVDDAVAAVYLFFFLRKDFRLWHANVTLANLNEPGTCRNGKPVLLINGNRCT